jgi:hypothetical protein
VDLFAGKLGWTRGLLDAGWDEVVAFDIEDRGDRLPGCQLVLQDVLTIDARKWRGRIGLICASPPCQRYSYMSMPWSRGKKIAAEYRSGERSIEELNALFNACFRIAQEAECPLVVENVKGAQPWVGKAKAHFGSQYLWGDVPALLPDDSNHRKGEGSGRSWFYKNGGNARSASSKSVERREWTANVSMIPYALAYWIGTCYYQAGEHVGGDKIGVAGTNNL